MRQLIPVILILGFSATFAQEKGSIKGMVKTEDGQPAASVSVALKGTVIGTFTNSQGEFKLNNVPTGVQTIVISFVGLESQERTGQVQAGKTLHLAEIILKESAHRLREVVVSDARLRETPYVSKMPLKNLENPQVYVTVSSDLLVQQAITNFDDALRNVPGIHKLWESTGRAYGDGASYYALRGFEAQATMVNGLPGLTSGSLDPANIERIEVIKGPSGTLFGSSLISYGGLVNTVTKKPFVGFAGEITYTAGSFGLNRVTADINAPLKSDRVLLRVNTAYHTENSFQDAGFRNAFFISPTLSVKANERLSFLLITEFMHEERATAPMLFLGRNSPLQWSNLGDLNYNRELSFTSNDLSIKNPRFNLQAQMNYKLSDTWTSQTVLARGQAKSDGYYSYLYDNENGLREFSLWISDQQGQIVTSDIQQNFIGDFKLGSVRNRVVVGLDYFTRNVIDNSSGYAWVHNANAQGDVNYDYPYTSEVETTEYYLSRTSIDNLLASTGISNSNVKDAYYSAYVSDVINVTPQLLAMASLRVDHFDTMDEFEQTALSPKFGLIYQPVADKLSLFANYMNGFKNVAPRSFTDQDGNVAGVQSFEPEHANQMEFGVKSNVFSDKLNATLSYYDIDVANVVTTLIQGNATTHLQGGRIESKGFEVDLSAHPIEGLSVRAGYSHNESKVLEGEQNNIWLETGRRPIASGPTDLFNAWATYTFKSGSLRGFGLGLGGNYSSALNILDSEVTGTFKVPGYTVFNTTLFYDTTAFRIALNVNNITDEAYYTGYSTINPQKPRNAVVSLAYKF